jgi:arylesterase / paraoxonase
MSELDFYTWPVLIPKVERSGFRRLLIPPFARYPVTDTNRVDHLNASARGLTDRIAVLDTRGPGRLASRIKWLSVENFSGVNGDGTLNLHGFDIRGDRNTDVLRIILINHRPPIDPVTGEALDATIVGANSTIEQFQTTVGGDTMRHLRTYIDPLIQTPNRVAWVTEHSFVFTNDHSNKVGFVSSLSNILNVD